MDQQTWAAVATMYNAWSPGTEDHELRLRSIADSVRGMLPEAVREAASRFRAGMVEGQNARFAPSEAEFVQEARRLHEIRSYRPRLASPVSRPNYGTLAPFQMHQQKALAENADRPVIKEDATYDEFKAMSKAGSLPAGSSWVACLAIIYGPKPKQHRQAAE